MDPLSKDLEQMIDILGLRETAVEVIVKRRPEMKKGYIGIYHVFSNEIDIRDEILPYWFATFSTLRHEFRHQQQRGYAQASLLFCVLVLMMSWAFGMQAGNVFFSHIAPFLVLFRFAKPAG